MVSLEYSLSGWNSELSDSELVTADEVDFHYRLMPGDISFRVGEACFDAQWGWVPIVGFAVTLLAIIRSLPTILCSTFEFTESDAAITFKLQNDQVVEISANYSDDIAVVPYRELEGAVEMFARRVLVDVLDRYSPLGSNEAFRSIRESIEKGRTQS